MRAKQGAAENAEGYSKGKNKKFWIRLGAIGAAVVALGVGAGIFVPKFFEEAAPNVVEEGFVTVSEPAPEDGSTPDMHSALENIAYMNAVFKAQESWYSEMHGTTDASLMEQAVSTYKQYSDGVLIVADITESAMVKAARQFCYAGEEVLWRLGSSYDASTYDEMMSAEWEQGEPYAHMYLDDFVKKNGLPATEFSVYVINEETLLSADEVVKNDDGSYSQTYYLDPATDKAPAHYANQMVFSGGLSALPEFTSIKVTYTFDENWQVLSSTVEESYKATMGISVNCSSVFTTVYEYGTARSESPDFEGYFKQYLGGEMTGPEEKEPTAVGCLGEAFGPVLQGPTIFDLSLTVNGTPLEGAVLLDVGDMTTEGISLSADLGSMQLWLEEGELYLRMGGIRGKLALKDVLGALDGAESVTGGSGEGTAAAEEGGLDLNALLAQLGEGEFTYDETSASLSASLTLGGMTLPVDFAFALEDGHASLETVTTHFAFEGIEADISLAYGKNAPAELPESEKGSYPDLLPHIETLASLLTGEALHADISYAAEGFAISGAIDISLANGQLAGELALTVNGAEKEISFAYADGYVLLNVDGLKLKADAEEALELIGQFLELPEMQAPELSLDIDKLLNNILSGDLGTLISMTETDNVLSVLVKGNELLELLGLDLGLDLGDVSLAVSDGSLSVSALGAEIALTQGEVPVINADEYIDILPYVNSLIELFSNEALRADISFETDSFAVSGAVDISLANGQLAGELAVALNGAEKEISFAYAEGYVLLNVDGLKLKANAEEAIAFIGQFVELPEMQMPELNLDIDKLLNNVLSGDLGTLISMTESENVLSVLVKGDELLELLGLDFGLDLGDVSLAVSDDSLSVSALGAEIALTQGEVPVINADEYINILPYANALVELFSNEALRADISYAAEGFAISGAIDISLANGQLAGELTVALNGAEKEIAFAYAEGYVLLDVDGLKVKANAEEALELIGQFVELPELNAPELSLDLNTLFQNILSGDLGALISMTEADNVLSVVVKGNELLELLGLDLGLDLGDVSLAVADGSLSVSALGAEIALTQGEVPVINADEYINILPYANALVELFSNEALRADIDYAGEGFAVSGAVDIPLKGGPIAGELTVALNGAEKEIFFAYADECVLLNVDGLKVKANAEEALEFIGQFLELPEMEMPELSLDIEKLLNNVLSGDLGTLISMTESENVLSVLVKGDELLELLGLDFGLDLGDVSLAVSDDSLSVSALGAEIALTQGEVPVINADEYIDILPYVNSLVSLFSSEALRADISFETDSFAVSGAVDISLANGQLAGELTVALNGAEKEIFFAYADECVLLDVDGLKLKANAEEALELIGQFLELPEMEMPELSLDIEKLLNNVLSGDLGTLISMTESENVLSVLVKGDELLELLGLDFGLDLGDVSLAVSDDSLSVSALGAEIALTQGEVPVINADEYINILPYANALVELFSSEALRADLSYSGEGFAVSGAVDISLANGQLAGELAVAVNGAEKEISFAYAEGYVLLNVDGLKVKANAEEALEFIGQFIELPAMEMPELSLDIDKLLNNILSGDLGTLISMTETDNVLSVLVKGNELLELLGLDLGLDLGDVSLAVSDGSLSVSALGAEIALTQGEVPVINADEYIDILPYVNSLIELFSNEALRADISFETDSFAVSGAVDISLANGQLAGELTVALNGAEKEISFAYAEGYVLLEVDGLKLKADAEEALELIGQFLELPEMQAPELSLDIDKLLNNILSGDLGTLISMTETDNVLSVLVKGNELLELLGLDLGLDLGDVSLAVSDGSLSVSALGAEIALTQGEVPVINADEYIDILPYVNSLVSLFSSEALRADISFETDSFAVSGAVDIPLKGGPIAGELTVALNGAEKEIAFAYAEGYVLLNVDGLKVKANAEEALEFIGQFLELPEMEMPELSLDIEKLLNNVLSGDLGTLISMTESENVLSVLVKGNELLELLGLDLGLDLGDVSLAVADGSLSVSALGAEIALTQGEVPVINADEYIDILPYAETIAEIFSSKYFLAEISLGIGELNLSGEVYFAPDPVAVRAELTLSEGGFSKLIKVEYEGEDLFVTVDGVTFRASAEKLLPLLTSALSLDGAAGEGFALDGLAGEGSIDSLKTLLALDFSEVIPEVSETGGVLSLLLNGDSILNALGIGYHTGEIAVDVGADYLSASCKALNLSLTLKKGSAFEIDHGQECADLQPVIDKALQIAEAQALSFGGSISLDAGGFTLPVDISRGTIAWENGFSLVLEGELSLGGGYHHFYLEADTTRVRIAYGGLGLVLPYDEFPELLETLNGVIDKVRPLLEKAGITLPDLSALSGALGNTGDGTFDLGSLDIGKLLSGITFCEAPGYLFGLTGNGLTLRLADEQDGIARADAEYTGEDFSLGADLSLGWFEGAVQMPEITYLSVEDLNELADYLTAAENTLKSNSVTLTLSPIQTEAGSISVTAQIYHGDTFPVEIDTENKTITVHADTYLHLNVNVAPTEGQLPLYLEAWVLDGDGDDELDFYVTASRMQQGEEGYYPLVVTATAGELMPLIASALPLLGVDVGFIDEYFVSHWVDAATVEQLSVIGDSLLDTLDFFGVFDSLFGCAQGSASEELIAGLVKGENTFSITLGGGALGLGSDLTLALEKLTNDAGEPYLKAVSLGIAGTDIAFGLNYDTITPAVPTLPQGQSYALDGMAELFTALANTATHTVGDGYALNETYLIEGSASLGFSIFGIEIPGVTVIVDALAVSITDEGDIWLDARISYGKLWVMTDIINADSTVDISIRGDMIYIKRTETDSGTTLYRAMPLSVFGATLYDQLEFILNLGFEIPTDDSEDTGGTPGEDLGSQAGNLLSGYDFSKAGSAEGITNDQWTLTLNGGALTDGVLSDIIVDLIEGNGQISKLNVESSIFSFLKLNANLSLVNGGEDYENTIVYDGKLSETVANGMDAAMENNNTNGWNTYLEGTEATVTLEYNGESKTQPVLVNGTTVLTNIHFPVLEEKEGHTLEWVQSGLTFTAQYKPNIYRVQFTTEDVLADGFKLEYDLPYGTMIEYYINGLLQKTLTVGAGDMKPALPALEGKSLWYEAVLEGNTLRLYALENYDTITLDYGGMEFGENVAVSSVTGYMPAVPSAEGYTFLGWWRQKDGAWEKVESLTYEGGQDITLYALWGKAEIAVDECSRKGFIGYSYKSSGSVSVEIAGSLKGEPYFAELLDRSCSISVNFRVHTGDAGEDKAETCDENGDFSISRDGIWYFQWTLTATVTFDSDCILSGLTISGSKSGSF